MRRTPYHNSKLVKERIKMNTILLRYLEQNISMTFHLLTDKNIHIKMIDFSSISGGMIAEEIAIPKDVFLKSDPALIEEHYLHPTFKKIFSRRLDFYKAKHKSDERKEFEKFWKESTDIFP